MPTIKLPYFGGVEVKLDDFADVESAEGRAALDAFMALTEADRLADSRHVFAYYRDYHKWGGAQDWLDASIGVPARVEDIWAHVKPGTFFVEKSRTDGFSYVVLEAECVWEKEHGLMLVWREGKALTKVSGYDGHFTNMEQEGDARASEIVYDGTDAEYTTYRDRLV